jgi:hypothetical protein
MGFRFRNSIRITKGLRINLSKSGASLSIGGRGATVNLSKRGAKVTAGLPGSGISWSETIKPGQGQQDPMQQHLPPHMREPAPAGGLGWLWVIALMVLGLIALGTLH